ncbi:TPA: hypothetical protein ACW331_000837 [Salmonella enterica subsp. enterica]
MTSREKFEAWWEQEKYDAKLNYVTGIMFNRIKANMFLSWEAASREQEQKLTDQAVQLANAESKCREMAAAENNLIDSECHVAELDEALRDKQALLEELDNALCELLPGTQYMDPPDGGSVTPLEQVRRMVADYRNRIAELESRTVILPNPYPKGYGLAADKYNFALEECAEAIRAAGIGVKGG